MKLLIVDDHPLLREGLAALLTRADPAATVLHARDGAEGCAALRAHPDMDAVLLDLVLPDQDGIEALREFGRVRPELAVIVLSSSEDPADVRRALAAGALGYVPKSAAPQTLLSALRLVLAGEIYVPPLMVRANGAPPAAPRHETVPEGMARLTERQRDVLRLIGQGFANKHIANQLALSDKTVKAHLTAIFRMLNVSNRTQAASAAREAGLV